MELESHDVPRLAQYDTVDEQTSLGWKATQITITLIVAFTLLVTIYRVSQMTTQVDNMSLMCGQMIAREKVGE